MNVLSNSKFILHINCAVHRGESKQSKGPVSHVTRLSVLRARTKSRATWRGTVNSSKFFGRRFFARGSTLSGRCGNRSATIDIAREIFGSRFWACAERVADEMLRRDVPGAPYDEFIEVNRVVQNKLRCAVACSSACDNTNCVALKKMSAVKATMAPPNIRRISCFISFSTVRLKVEHI